MTLSCKGLLISIWLMTLTVTLISMPAIATDISPRCAAAVDRAAGRYSDCLLRAEAHFVRRGNSTRVERTWWMRSTADPDAVAVYRGCTAKVRRNQREHARDIAQ